MAEFTSAEKVNIGYENEYSTDAMTGGPDKRRQLYYQLIQSMKKAESVDIIVSFLSLIHIFTIKANGYRFSFTIIHI